MPGIMTHLYVATWVEPGLCNDKEFLFGNIYPDLEKLIIGVDENHELLKGLIKKLRKKKEYKTLCRGIDLHLIVDKYAHKDYIEEKVKKLHKKFPNLNEKELHMFTEIALDKQIIEENNYVLYHFDTLKTYTKWKNLIGEMAKHFKVDEETAINNVQFYIDLFEGIGYMAGITGLNPISVKRAYSTLKKIKKKQKEAKDFKFTQKFHLLLSCKKEVKDYEGYFDWLIEKLKKEPYSKIKIKRKN